MYRQLYSRAVWMGLAFVGLVLFGTVGYVVVEQWTPLDGAYMTIVTMSTVGYGETNELSPVGRAFTALLISICLIVMSLWTAAVTSFVVENDLRGTFFKSRIVRMIAKLQKHAVVCGATEIGIVVAQHLSNAGMSVVVIDADPSRLARIRDRFANILTLEGSPTDEMTLADARLIDAQHVVAATDVDIDNLLIAITSKDLAHKVYVSAKCDDPSIANRMRKAGVDDVVSPTFVTGNQLASLITTVRKG